MPIWLPTMSHVTHVFLPSFYKCVAISLCKLKIPRHWNVLKHSLWLQTWFPNATLSGRHLQTMALAGKAIRLAKLNRRHLGICSNNCFIYRNKVSFHWMNIFGVTSVFEIRIFQHTGRDFVLLGFGSAIHVTPSAAFCEVKWLINFAVFAYLRRLLTRDLTQGT